MRRYKANQPHRQGVYASLVGYCRDEIIRDSYAIGRDALACARVFVRESATSRKNEDFIGITTRAYLSDFADHFCFLRLYEIMKTRD